jgi:hypothetical protein
MMSMHLVLPPIVDSSFPFIELLLVSSIAASSNTKNQNNEDESSLGEELLHHWFLSVWCPEDVSSHFSQALGRSAFSLYQRPSGVPLNDTTAHQVHLMDTSLLDADEDNEEYRDDVETSSSEQNEWPSIERTFSFDDWNVKDEQLPSPRNFRFDEWSCTSSTMEEISDKDESVYSTSSTNSEQIHETCNPNVIYNMDDDWVIQKAYTNSSSTRALIPPSNSFTFQPIRDSSDSRLSLDTSAAPTISLHSDDPLSILSADLHANDDIDIPECQGIPRVRSEDEEALYPRSAVLTIPINLGDDDEYDEPSQCYSSPTNYVPPIPQVIYVHKEPKGWKEKIIRSWKHVSAIGRHNSSSTPGNKNCFKRRGSKKATHGEF